MGFDNWHSIAVEYSGLSLAYLFSLASYIKFQRRYAEEALFAFAFCKDGDIAEDIPAS
jgi:hypothetical protein